MPVKLNSKGRSHLNSLVSAGKVNTSAGWSMSAADEDKILGDPPDWGTYGKWFLGVDGNAAPDTKAHYKYPFGKGGSVYRSALIAIKQRGAAQGADAIVSAADSALEKIDNGRFDMGEIEKRTVNFDIHIESRDDGRKLLRGHAAVFNQEVVIAELFREKIAPGAFINTIIDDDQRALWNHDPNFVLGRKGNNTLILSEDKRGLSIEIDPPDTQLIRDLVVAPIVRGDVTQMSFTFRVVSKDGEPGEEWLSGREEGLLDLRILKHVRVLDVSPVTFPAYEGTDIALRNHADWKARTQPQQESSEDNGCIDTDIRRKRLDLKTKEE